MIFGFRGLKRAPHLKNPPKIQIYRISIQEKNGRNFGVAICLKGTFFKIFLKKKKKKMYFYNLFLGSFLDKIE